MHLAQCWNNISSYNCKICISSAGQELRWSCTKNRGAIIWYEACLVKYEHQNFLGRRDKINRIYVTNTTVSPQSLLDEKVHQLMTQLCTKASTNPPFCANGRLQIGEAPNWDHIYGMAQCTGDLWVRTCKDCLDVAIREVLVVISDSNFTPLFHKIVNRTRYFELSIK